MRILIANQNAEFMKGISDQLSKVYEFKLVNDGQKVLELCCTYKPDLLVLDMELPYMDGMSVLRTIRSCGLHAEVIAITVCSESDYVLRQLAQLGVRYILPKPCTVTSAATRIYEMARMNVTDEWSLEDEANSLLLTLGMRMNLGGYRCVKEAIMLMLRDRTLQLTKNIYPTVAQITGRTPQSVERVIRSAVNDAWQRRDENVWNMFFKPDRSGQPDCPSNGYFISRLCMCVERRKIG